MWTGRKRTSSFLKRIQFGIKCRILFRCPEEFHVTYKRNKCSIIENIRDCKDETGRNISGFILNSVVVMQAILYRKHPPTTTPHDWTLITRTHHVKPDLSKPGIFIRRNQDHLSRDQIYLAFMIDWNGTSYWAYHEKNTKHGVFSWWCSRQLIKAFHLWLSYGYSRYYYNILRCLLHILSYILFN